jgi:hypothetical protein
MTGNWKYERGMQTKQRVEKVSGEYFFYPLFKMTLPIEE